MFLRAPLSSLLLALVGSMPTANAQPQPAEWAALGAGADLSGVWVPDVADQRRKERGEAPPWTAAANLVVDTVGVIPQAYIALSEAAGIPNNGDMHIVERIRVDDADTLAVELTIAAPEVLTEPWTTTRLFVRRRGPQFDIIEGQCVQGELVEGVDEHGNAIFEHAPPTDDGRVPLAR